MSKGPKPKPIEESFWARVEKTDSCWWWRGYVNNNGYGRLYVALKKKSMSAHKLSYVLAHGDVPEGMVIMHSCDNRKCVNPEHLRVGTASDNQRDAMHKNRAYFSRIKGDYHPRSDLSEISVARALLVKDALPVQDIANALGTSKSNIYKIVQKVSWPHYRPHLSNAFGL